VQRHEGVEVRRSGRIRRPPTRYQDFVTDDREITQAIAASMAQITEEESTHDTIAFESLYSPSDHNLSESVTDPDTLYLWEARKESDFPKFLEAIQKEMDDHTKRGSLEGGT
jgi:hypothetical protein